MDLNNKNKKVISFLCLVVVSSCALLGIILLKDIKNNIEITAKVEQSIIEAGWPQEVPIINSEFIKIDEQSSGSWSINFNKPVSYDVFREYLIDLYAEGFKPISEFGSKNPKLLSLEEPTEDGFILFWSGQNSKYTIETYWQKIDDTNDSSEITEDDYLTILLYSNFVDDIYQENFEDENISGDNTLNSGDDSIFSGDKVITSGEFILEDRNEREED